MKFLLIILLSTGFLAKASGINLQNYIENPKIVGEARLTVLFWDVYDASLYADEGQFDASKPYALTLKYLRDFDGDDIASRSVDEMRKQGVVDEIVLAKWYQQMNQIFPDVKEGESITGIVDENQHSVFYYNDRLLGKVEDPKFSRAFFNIWLSENTSEPEMREQLLGLSN